MQQAEKKIFSDEKPIRTRSRAKYQKRQRLVQTNEEVQTSGKVPINKILRVCSTKR